jgi:hypothetical protein
MRAAEAPQSDDISAVRFLLYTDAALKRRGFPGIGGWLQGLLFTLRISDHLLGYPIVKLDFLVIIYSILTSTKALAETQTHFMIDPMTSNLILANDGAHVDQTQFLHLEFLRANWLDGVRHVFGELSPFADFPLTSRG